MWWLVWWIVELCALPFRLVWRLEVEMGLVMETSAQEVNALRTLLFPLNVSSSESSTEPRALQRIGFVIAHPDDEAMFFSPTIKTLSENINKRKKQGVAEVELCLLCLSSGNFDGLGEIRKKELVESCVRLGIDRDAVTIVDDKDIQDDPNREWPHEKVAAHIDRFVQANNITTLITFDEKGVSSHPNHCSAYQAVKLVLDRSKIKDRLVGYALITHSLARKYSGLLDAWILTPLQERRIANNKRLLFYTPQLSAAREAMVAHRSQLVWFRHLFIAFSTYTFVNILRPI
eukprot:TRINITY_DN11673_c0_g1_i1.p1 TRINITY_DN11673_c0_g1~~TRINITY_DN11673_c0_g1_i1.p1  ORF type:complete len:289 (-),score=45.65 TRINITY_DN11673_c0_g1_i1:54-920(-)